MKNKSVRLYSEKHLENIGAVFKNLYDDEVLTDLTLYCKDGCVKVHKMVLAASSAYFKNIFCNSKEHPDRPTAFYMYGISLEQLKKLVELIYKGSINLPTDNFNSVYDLAEELQIVGLLVDGINERPTSTPAPCAKTKFYNRETRFKGQKRVNVDFNGLPEIPVIVSTVSPEEGQEGPSTAPPATVIKQEVTDTAAGKSPATESQESLLEFNRPDDKDDNSSSPSSVDESADEKKERKHKCEVCNASFTRASHLSRHQLVHTGERPFQCEHCNRAFSRLDKLKNHIQRAHESLDPLPADALYTIGHVQILSPEESMYESAGYESNYHVYNRSVIETSTELRKEHSDSVVKKKRGRPRKHPIVVNEPKRPRGRPRIRSIDRAFVTVPPSAKRPRGRPRINPIGSSLLRVKSRKALMEPFGSSTPLSHEGRPAVVENFDITNMPYGDINYLTNSMEHSNDMMDIVDEPELIEPLVEIQVEQPSQQMEQMTDNPQPGGENDPQQSFMQNIGLLENTIGKIGECTISVAPSTQ